MRSMNFGAVLTAGLLALGAGSASAAPVTIYQDDFDGGTGDLNGLAPDVGASTWVASEIFNADGSVDNTGTNLRGSLTLDFDPSNGLVYTLDASISGISGNGNWFAMGFGNGQSDALSSNNRFITGDLVGTAWMLFRGDSTVNGNVAQLGTGALGAGNGGTADGEAWAALNNEGGGDIDLRIVLDTTGGDGTWTATWSAKRSADASYSVVRATELVGNEANFTSVGIAISDASSVDGTIENFALTSEVPEPSSLALLGLGGLLIARRRRG